MSDRRSHEERLAAVQRAAREMTHVGAATPDDFTEIFDRHGFGEAWKRGWTETAKRDGTPDPYGIKLIILEVENVDFPEFLLLRVRENHPASEHGWSWIVYTWGD